MSRHAEAVLAVIRRHPGRTYPELYALAKDDGDTVLPNEAALQRRLSDLKKVGLIRAAGSRVCSVHGEVMTVYEVTECQV